MTIEVKITNKDTGRSLEVLHVEHDKETGRKSERFAANVEPGEAHTFHCYLLRDLLIRERDLVAKSIA